MPFELKTFTKAKMSSVNVRTEKHGPELVPAVDLKFSIDASNDILDKFHVDLKSALYCKRQEEDTAQGELEGVDPVTSLPNLKFPRMEMPIKWDTAGSGYTLEIDFGLGGSSNLQIYGCDINNFSISAKEGGTIETKFRVQASNVDERILGKIATMVEHEVTIQLLAPTVEDVAPVLEKMESPFLNQAELDADTSGQPENPFEPGTPAAALAESLGA